MAKSTDQTEFENKVSKRILTMEKGLDTLLKDETSGIYKALEELEKYVKSNSKTSDYDPDAFKKEMWTKISSEWSKSLSKQIIKSLSTDLTLLLSDIRFNYNEFGD